MDLLGQVLHHGPTMLFQPIVDLVDGDVVGYEALARGPAGSALESPDAMFAEARRTGRVVELDWACRAAAARAALAGGLRLPLSLFVNLEPETAGVARPATAPLLDDEGRQLRGVVEFTERELLRRPAQVLEAAQRIRERGGRVALDDVGADPASTSFLALLMPDVIKLDMALIQTDPNPHVAETVQAVMAHAERTGAHVLAEGIETERQLETALSLGARFGQGYRFGRPAPLPSLPSVAAISPILAVPDPTEDVDTPFDLVARSDKLRTSRKPLLVEMSKHLELFAKRAPDTVVLLGAFQQGDYFSAATAERYADLAENLTFVAALGVGMAEAPGPGVRGVPLMHEDRLTREWTVVVLGVHVAAALIAREVGDDASQEQRLFQSIVTHDRSIVIAAARALMRRVPPI
jgi:EAL domain-containing protein (putative c-di-GMP-specific phosphodiesterase class I)